MNPQPAIDVFVLGETTGDVSTASYLDGCLSLRLIPTGTSSFAEFVQKPLSATLEAGESEIVAIAADPAPATIKGIAISAFIIRECEPPRQPPAASLTVERIAPGYKERYLSICCGVNLLYAPRARHRSIVFLRRSLREIWPLRPVAEPVWDWVIRAALAGRRVDSTAVMPDSEAHTARLPLLAPPRPGEDANWLHEHLTATSLKDLGVAFKSKVDEVAIRAGLYQWHDFLDESHELSQSIEGQGENQLGDYWHAIMHRREPDYSNAKYWFRRIGNQPTWRDLRQCADAVLADCKTDEAAAWRERLQVGAKWNPLAFVDLCEECAADETSELAIAARRIQYAEMCLLM